VRSIHHFPQSSPDLNYGYLMTWIDSRRVYRHGLATLLQRRSEDDCTYEIELRENTVFDLTTGIEGTTAMRIQSEKRKMAKL